MPNYILLSFASAVFALVCVAILMAIFDITFERAGVIYGLIWMSLLDGMLIRNGALIRKGIRTPPPNHEGNRS